MKELLIEISIKKKLNADNALFMCHFVALINQF